MNHTLEESRLFVYIAWTVVIIGGFCVIQLTMMLNNASEALVANKQLVTSALETTPRSVSE